MRAVNFLSVHLRSRPVDFRHGEPGKGAELSRSRRQLDPSLIFVMASALAVTFIGTGWCCGGRGVLAERFYLPSAIIIDGRLILGAAMFGVGWGLSGFCPGPAIVSLPLLANGTVVIVPAMLAGIGVARLRMQGKASRADPVAQAD